MSITLAVTAKGQVTLRKQVLNHLGARQGDRLQLDLLPAGRIQLRAKPGRPVTSVFGLLARPENPRLTLDELDRLAAEGWAGRS